MTSRWHTELHSLWVPGERWRKLLGLALGLKISCQRQKYSGEVIATHSTTEQNRKKLMVFITASLHCLLAWEVTWCLKPCWIISLGREEDLSMSLTFLQSYSFQEKKMKRSYFPEEKVAQSISLAGICQICLSPVSLVELPVEVFQKLVINF